MPQGSPPVSHARLLILQQVAGGSRLLRDRAGDRRVPRLIKSAVTGSAVVSQRLRCVGGITSIEGLSDGPFAPRPAFGGRCRLAESRVGASGPNAAYIRDWVIADRRRLRRPGVSAGVHDHGDAGEADGGAEQVGAVGAEAVEGDALQQ
jgi:hypothetical protein